MAIHKIEGKKTSGSEVIFGTAKDDWIFPLGGSDTVDGRGGYDTVVVEWASTNFEISTYPGGAYMDTISGASSADKVTLINVEAVQFPDKTVLLYKDQNFTDGVGGEFILGNWGLDTVTYAGARQDYSVTLDSSGVDVSDNKGLNGTDRLVQVERIHFSDMSLALDLHGHAGEVLQILGAVFGAEAIHNKAYVGIGLHYLDQLNFTATELMALALNVRLGDQVTNPAEVVRTLYQNVVGSLPTASVQQEFVGLIESGQHTPVSLAMLASQTSLNLTLVGLMGALAVPLEYLPSAA
jgi:hypothetical protein